jgi:hypothetical protein
MRRTEYPHHTREQIEGYLTEAVSIVDAAEVPDAFAEAAFTKAVELLAAKQIVMEQVGAGLDLSALRAGH